MTSSSNAPQSSTAPIVEAAEIVGQTIASPSIPVLVEDLVMVHSLVSDVKAKLAGKPASLLNLFHVLFNL